jgi:hypothetical protein
VQATPAKLPWAKKVVQLSASLDGHFAAAVDAAGVLYTWGAGEMLHCYVMLSYHVTPCLPEVSVLAYARYYEHFSFTQQPYLSATSVCSG